MANADLPIVLHRIGYREQGTAYHYGPHRHDVHQWYCVLYGTVEMMVDDREFVLAPEESILIPPGAIRSPRSRDRAPGYLWAHFTNQRLTLGAITNCVLATPPELQQDVLDLVSEVQQPADADADDLVGALLVKLLVGLRRSVTRASASAPALSVVNAVHHRELVRQVDSFMRNNLTRALSRRQVADAVHLSPAHLARVYRQATGRTLVERLTELRIEYGKHLLLESTLSVTQVGLSVGYRSFSHFSSVFKALVGIPPSDYRLSGGRTWRRTL
jgi:AraC-like DNA-binding protein